MEKNESDSEELAKKKLDFELFELEDKHPGVFDEYSKLLIEMQTNLVKENGGKPIMVTTEQREELVKQAHTNVSMGHIDSVKMERDWERASKDGRPPIGGAQDD